MTISRNIRHLLLCSVAFSLTATNVSAQEATTLQQRRFDFDMPAQPMADALLSFSRITGLQVASSPVTLQGLRSGALRGRMSVAEALRRLTAGSPAEGRIVGDTVTVERRDRISAADTASATPIGADDEAIVVVGFRESLARAEQLKRAAVGSQDVILAQDIAAFPDQNLAESLQRIPGVAISRDSGEGRQISLRGLGPDFTRTQLNGMEVLTNTSSGIDARSAVSRTRSFDYSIFASELFNKVTVEKSYAADQDEGGIGGTVGLRTAKPFDYARSVAVVSAKGQVNQYTDKLTPRLVGLASGRWGDVGALVSAAYSRADTIEWGYRNWNWSQINFGARNVDPAIPAATRALLTSATGANRVWNSRAQTYASWPNQRQRLGITSALQYQPDEHTDVTVDVLFGRLKNKRETDALGAAGTNNVSSNNITGTQVLTAVTIDDHNSITDAAFRGVDMRSEARDTRDTTDFWQVALNGRTDLTDRLHVSALLGWSKSTFRSHYDQVHLEAPGRSYSFSGLNTDKPQHLRLRHRRSSQLGTVRSRKPRRPDRERVLQRQGRDRLGLRRRLDHQGRRELQAVRERRLPASQDLQLRRYRRHAHTAHPAAALLQLRPLYRRRHRCELRCAGYRRRPDRRPDHQRVELQPARARPRRLCRICGDDEDRRRRGTG